MVFTFLKNGLNLRILAHAPVPQVFENLFPSKAEEGAENYDLLYQNFILFSLRFAFLNVMALQFCKYYLSYSVILSLLLLSYNHDNLTLKFH